MCARRQCPFGAGSAAGTGGTGSGFGSLLSSTVGGFCSTWRSDSCSTGFIFLYLVTPAVQNRHSHNFFDTVQALQVRQMDAQCH